MVCLKLFRNIDDCCAQHSYRLLHPLCQLCEPVPRISTMPRCGAVAEYFLTAPLNDNHEMSGSDEEGTQTNVSRRESCKIRRATMVVDCRGILNYGETCNHRLYLPCLLLLWL